MQTPSVGRIVHYVRMSDAEHIAAVITRTYRSDDEVGTADHVDLTFFPPDPVPSGAYFDSVVPYDARMSPGTWHYPEHVGTVQWHESEGDEASKREGPVSNSPDADGR